MSAVCVSAGHNCEPYQNSRIDLDAVWVVDSGGLREPCIRWGPDPLREKEQFLGSSPIELH